MSRPKKRTITGRFTKEAAEIVIEMLQEGKVQGDLEWLSGKQTPPTFAIDRNTAGNMPYFIGGYWVYRDLSWDDDTIIGFTRKPDRKEFKRRWRERYPKEAKPETQVETKREPEIELTYPLFVKSRENGAMIFFTSKYTGICVSVGTGNNRYEQFLNYWIEATNTDHWQHLTFAEAETEIFGEKND